VLDQSVARVDVDAGVLVGEGRAVVALFAQAGLIRAK
jgi:hypothetical protein